MCHFDRREKFNVFSMLYGKDFSLCSKCQVFKTYYEFGNIRGVHADNEQPPGAGSY